MTLPIPIGPSGIAHIRFSHHWRGQIVYYLERADGLIKIGTTSHYKARRAALVKQHGRLVLLAFEYGDATLEHARHDEFWWHRANPIAEWFRPSPDLITHVHTLRAAIA